MATSIEGQAAEFTLTQLENLGAFSLVVLALLAFIAFQVMLYKWQEKRHTREIDRKDQTIERLDDYNRELVGTMQRDREKQIETLVTMKVLLENYTRSGG